MLSTAALLVLTELVTLASSYTTSYLTNVTFVEDNGAELPVCASIKYIFVNRFSHETTTNNIVQTCSHAAPATCSCLSDCYVHNDCCLLTNGGTLHVAKSPSGKLKPTVCTQYRTFQPVSMNKTTMSTKQRLGNVKIPSVIQCDSGFGNNNVRKLCEYYAPDNEIIVKQIENSLQQSMDDTVSPKATLYRGPIRVNDYLYYNIFCALCNGVPMNNFGRLLSAATQPVYLISKGCQPNENTATTKCGFAYYCHWDFTSKDNRPCHNDQTEIESIYALERYLPEITSEQIIISDCLPQYREHNIHQKCKAYINYMGVFDSTRQVIIRMYKNGYCALCNQENQTNLVCVNFAMEGALGRDYPKLSYPISYLIHDRPAVKSLTTLILRITWIDQKPNNQTKQQTDFLKDLILLSLDRSAHVDEFDQILLPMNNTSDANKEIAQVLSLLVSVSRQMFVAQITVCTIERRDDCLLPRNAGCTASSMNEAIDTLVKTHERLLINSTGTDVVWYACGGSSESSNLGPLDVLSIISILMLVICLVNNALTKNVAKPFVINACAALLLANIMMFFVGRKYIDTICKFITILAHISWLNVFSSQCLLASAYLMITKLKAIESISMFNVFVKLFLTWIVSVALVITAIIVGDLDDARFAYFNDNMCWISSKFSRLVFFIAPLGVCIFINLAQMGALAYGIRKMSIKDSVERSKKSNMWLGVVVTKLSFILGIAWLLPLIDFAAQSEVLTVIYDTILSGQGALLAISLMWNRQNRDKLKMVWNSKYFTKTISQ